MERIANFILLAALMGACENTNPNDTQDDTDTNHDMFKVAFTAILNKYGWEGDEVVLLESEDPGADFVATSDGGETMSGTTPDTVELSAGEWNSSFFYDESTMLYIGWSSGNTTTTQNFSATLCADLSGDWECRDEIADDPHETRDAVMNGCSIHMEGIETLTIDGNMVASEFYGGSLVGIASDDEINMIVSINGMDDFNAVCVRI
jgi:hypothetical protein